MVNENLLWNFIKDNTSHIRIINEELASVKEAIVWVKMLIGVQFTLHIATLGAVLRNIYLTRNNKRG